MPKAKDNLKPKVKTPAVKKKSNAGRKGKYFTHVEPKLLLIASWCRDGATDEIIYKKLGISKDSFYEYKKQHPEFSDTLKKSKEVIDVIVENALLSKALGFKESLKKPIKVKNIYYENGKRIKEVEEVIFADEEVYIQPDTTAQIFWLKNRRPDKWKNTERVEFVEDNEGQQDMHLETIQALKNRNVNGLLDDEVIDDE